MARSSYLKYKHVLRQPLSIFAFLVLLILLLQRYDSQRYWVLTVIYHTFGGTVNYHQVIWAVPDLRQESMSYKLARKPSLTFSNCIANTENSFSTVRQGVFAKVQPDLCVSLPIFISGFCAVCLYANKWSGFHRMEADSNNEGMTRV